MSVLKIGVIGAGTMGNGIAHVFSLYKNDIILVDMNEEIIDSALSTIHKNMERQCSRDVITEKSMRESYNNIIGTTNLEKLSDCNLVIEAVKEDYKIKSDLFQKLDKICNQNTILASNTSSISINDLAKNISRSDKFIGMHFMNPVPVMKLVEIIKGDNTSRETLHSIKELTKSIDKISVECNDSPGFVSNRILMPMINEAAFCYMEGVAEVDAIDSIMKLGMGHPMGPLKLADLIGIDVCVYIMNVLYEGFKDEKYKVCPLLEKMVSKNQLGKKTKEGFYKYEF